MTQFELLETVSTSLWDFGWCDRSVFRVSDAPSGAAPEAILRGFLGSPISRRSFCQLPDPWGADVDRHGPLLESGLPDVTYEQLWHNQLVGEVHAVLGDQKFELPPSGAQQEAVAAWLASAGTDECFALRRRDDGRGEVDWNHVWLIFREFVCFAPDRHRMTVAVIGFD